MPGLSPKSLPKRTATSGETGFRPVDHRTVGRRVTLRFAADRLRRAGVPLTGWLPGALDAAGLGDLAVYLNPGDIMQVVAVAETLVQVAQRVEAAAASLNGPQKLHA